MKLRKLKRRISGVSKTGFISPAELFKKARQNFTEGNRRQASELFSQLTRLKPDHPAAWRFLGLLAFQNGDTRTGKDLIKKALAIKPDFPEALFDLAGINQACGELNEALTNLQSLTALTANFAEAYNQIGNISAGFGKYAQAEEAYQKALALEPGNALFFFNLGNLYANQRLFPAAAECYRKALAERPAYIEALDNLGYTLQEMGDYPTAIEMYRRSLSIRDDNPLAHNNLATTYKTISLLAEAEISCKHALSYDDSFAAAHNNLGTIYLEQGKKDQSLESFKRCLELEPGNGEAWRHLVFCESYSDADHENFRRISSLLSEPFSPGVAAVHLNFAAGKIMDDCGKYPEAIAHFRQANELQNSLLDYDAAISRDLTARIIKLSSKEFFAELPVRGSESEVPIFIVGMPRSGTSLVEQILCTHSRIDGVGEVHKIHDIANNLPAILEVSEPYPECLGKISQEKVTTIAHDYLEYVRGLTGTDSARITNKTPANYFHLGLIKILFPNAKVIHCTRTARDVIISLYSQFFPSIGYSFSVENIIAAYRDHNLLMNHWKQLFPEIHTIAYEDLVNDFAEQVGKLIEYSGLAWESECLEFHQSGRAVKTASAWQVQQPIYRTSVNRWHNYSDLLGPFENELNRLQAMIWP